MLKANHPMGQPFAHRGGQTGVLLIHGFTGTVGQVRPLAEALAREGYTVRAPLLPGHGTTFEDMAKSSWQDWLAAVRREYVALEEEMDAVVVAGLSMGGTLAAILAEEYAPDGCVCLSAAIEVRDRLAPLAGVLWPLMPKMSWKNLEHEGDYDESTDAGYVDFPVKKVADLNRLRAIARRNLALITAPTLVVQPVHDETVAPRSAKIILSGIASKEKKLVELDNSPHVCTLGPERERVCREVIAFIRGLK